MNNDSYYDVIIIGAGASGMFCALRASQFNLKILVIEHNPIPGKKILISGGGKSNFTNIYNGPEHFLSENKHFMKSALSRYSPWDFIDYVEGHNIDYYEKKDGQQFCRKSAKFLNNALWQDIIKNGVSLSLKTKISKVEKKCLNQNHEVYIIETNKGEFHSPKLVVATGGLSFKKLGASSLGHQIAKQFGHKVTDLRAGLVGLKLEVKDFPYKALQGVSFKGSIAMKTKNKKILFHDDILFTHFGISGPAVLQLSSYWSKGEEIQICFLPDFEWDNFWDSNGDDKKEFVTSIQKFLAQKLSRYLLERSHIANKALNQYSTKEKEEIQQTFSNLTLRPLATAGYDRAEVTVGGVSTDMVSSKSFESQIQNGLYFIGEVLDVTGHLGGHNFQWAWASANACALSLGAK